MNHIGTMTTSLFKQLFGQAGSVATESADPFVQISFSVHEQTALFGGTNLETTILARTPEGEVQVSADVEMLIERAFLMSMMDSFIGETISFFQDDQEYVIESSGRGSTILTRLAMVDRTLMRLPDDASFTDVVTFTARGFKRRIGQLMVTVAKPDNAAAGVTLAMRIYDHNNMLSLMSADRKTGTTRVLLGDYEKSRSIGEWCVLGQAIDLVADIVGNDDQVVQIGTSEKNGLLRWTIGNTTVYTALYGESFLKIDVLYDLPRVIQATLNLKDLKAACNAVYVTADEREFARMYVDFNANNVGIRTYRPGKGRTSDMTIPAIVSSTDDRFPLPYTVMLGASQLDSALTRLNVPDITLAPVAYTNGNVANIQAVAVIVKNDPAYQHLTNIFNAK